MREKRRKKEIERDLKNYFNFFKKSVDKGLKK